MVLFNSVCCKNKAVLDSIRRLSDLGEELIDVCKIEEERRKRKDENRKNFRRSDEEMIYNAKAIIIYLSEELCVDIVGLYYFELIKKILMLNPLIQDKLTVFMVGNLGFVPFNLAWLNQFVEYRIDNEIDSEYAVNSIRQKYYGKLREVR